MPEPVCDRVSVNVGVSVGGGVTVLVSVRVSVFDRVLVNVGVTVGGGVRVLVTVTVGATVRGTEKEVGRHWSPKPPARHGHTALPELAFTLHSVD